MHSDGEIGIRCVDSCAIWIWRREVLIFRLCCGCESWVSTLFSDYRGLGTRANLLLLGMLDFGCDIGFRLVVSMLCHFGILR